MLKDEKNKEYLDQIYYTLAEISLNNTDTNAAIENYFLSTKNSVNNDAQKALSFLSLANLEYANKNYIATKNMYDTRFFTCQRTIEIIMNLLKTNKFSRI